MMICSSEGKRSSRSQPDTGPAGSGSSGRWIRGEETPESDLDLLVEFEPGRSLLDHIALAQDLKDLLGREVDVVTEGGLHWYIRDRVCREAVSL